MQLEINQAANLVVVNGRSVRGHHRWEATFVAQLAAPAAAGGVHRLDARQFATQLLDMGQQQVLNRKQISRLIDSVEGMFSAVGQADALSRRLSHTPRTRTVGPWNWRCQPGDQTVVLDARLTVRGTADEAALPQLAACGSPDISAALCRRLLVVQALFREGSLGRARDELEDAAAWVGASNELLAWRASRLAESLWKLRNFTRAAEAVQRAEDIVARHWIAAMFLGDSVGLLRPRLAYQCDPINAHRTVLSPLLSMLAGCKQIDRLTNGLGHNLSALCYRRWFDDVDGTPTAQAVQLRRNAALAHSFAAIFCFATVESPTYAEYACANLGHLFSRLFALGYEASPAAAFEWYGLAQAWHNRFELADDSVWEYIFMGDLMLYQPGAWSAFERLSQHVKWEGLRPDVVEFYQVALRRAQEIGDPRQLAHAALNLWHFARKTSLSTEAEAAGAALLEVFQAHPDLRQLLQAEGYPLPRVSGATLMDEPAITEPHEVQHG